MHSLQYICSIHDNQYYTAMSSLSCTDETKVTRPGVTTWKSRMKAKRESERGQCHPCWSLVWYYQIIANLRRGTSIIYISCIFHFPFSPFLEDCSVVSFRLLLSNPLLYRYHSFFFRSIFFVFNFCFLWYCITVNISFFSEHDIIYSVYMSGLNFAHFVTTRFEFGWVS